MEQNYGLLRNLPYFNKATLGDALGKSGENLNYWVKKLIRQQELIPLKKGLYTTRLYLLGLEKNPVLRQAYLEYLANITRYPSYISLEYALSKYGLIPEGVFSLTSVTLKSSRIYVNSLGNFIYRNIKKDLFGGFKNEAFEEKRVKIATKAKALFDFLYLRKAQPLDSLRINWDVFLANDREEFAAIVKKSGSPKMERILKSLKW